jgi:TraX protein
MQMLAYPLPLISSFAANAFKGLALSLMLSDHIHYVFFNRQLEWLYWLSRLVFPIFALIAAQNLELHRANPKRYISRLIFYGIIAQPCYLLCFGVPYLNVLFTLAASVAAWWWLEVTRSQRVHPLLRYGLVLIIASNASFLEFGWAGVVAVPIYAALMRRGAWWDWLAAFVLSFGIVAFTAPWVMPLIALGLWVLASKVPVRARRKPSRWVQYASYAFYPVHLALIALVARLG